MNLRHVCFCGQEFDWRGALVQHILASGKEAHGVDVEVNRAFCDAIYRNQPAAEIRVPEALATKAAGVPYRAFSLRR